MLGRSSIGFKLLADPLDARGTFLAAPTVRGLEDDGQAAASHRPISVRSNAMIAAEAPFLLLLRSAFLSS
jgi:hypothetical protein